MARGRSNDVAEHGEAVMGLLSSLAEAGRTEGAESEGSPLSEAALQSVRALVAVQPPVRRMEGETEGEGADTAWQALAAAGVASSNVSRCLQWLLDNGSKAQRTLAAATYMALLCTNGCPIFSLFDPFVFNKVLKLAKDVLCATESKGKGSAPAEEEEEEEDMEGLEMTGARDSSNDAQTKAKLEEWCLGMLQDLTVFLRVMVLSELPDAKRSIAEALVDVTKAATGAGKVRIMGAAYASLAELLQAHHGSIQESAVIVMRLLAPSLWTLDSQVRKMTLAFFKSSVLALADSVYAAAAAARFAMLQVPDKADIRVVAVSSASDLASHLPIEERQLLGWFVARLATSAKTGQRQTAVLTAAELLSGERVFGGLMDDGGAAAMTAPVAGEHEADTAPLGLVCLAVLAARCSDKHATVRAKALQGLCHAVDTFRARGQLNQFMGLLAISTEFPLKECLASQMDTPSSAEREAGADAGTPMPQRTPATGVTPGRPDPNPPTPMSASLFSPAVPASARRAATATAPVAAPKVALPQWTGVPGSAVDEGTQLRGLMERVRRRVSDEKAPVRKQAVLLLEALLLARAEGGHLPEEEDIAAVEAATSDALVSVRRSGLNVASHLLKQFPAAVQVASMWVRTALPLVRDADQSLQEILLDEFQALVLQRCVTASVRDRAGLMMPVAEEAACAVAPILAALAVGGAMVTTSLGRACMAAAKRRQLKGKAVCAGVQAILEAGAEGMEALGAWRLLMEVSAQEATGPSWEFLHGRWTALSTAEEGAAGEGGQLAGEVQSALLKVIANAAVAFPQEEASKLADSLLRALKTFRLPPAAASAHVEAMSKLVQTASGGAAWTSQLLKAAEAELSAYTAPGGAGSLRSRQAQGGEGDAGMQAEDFRAVTALFTTGELSLLPGIRVPDRLIVATQALTAPHIVAEAAAAAAVIGADSSCAGEVVEVPAAVQAHTWTALGKMCLADKGLAKKCLPLFVQELGRSKLPAVRNNIVIALADMCVHFTALVDAHIPRLAACIRDPCELVRRQTLALLVHLLQKDFVKWRGVLFHRFLLSLVDPSPQVVHLAEYLLGSVLGPRASLLSYNHFVEAVFVLNNCKAGIHAGAIAAVAAGPTELHSDRLFCLEGRSSEMREKRATIYKVLLSHMQPEHKFATATKLCHEVLQAVSEGSIGLAEGEAVLSDALAVLTFKEIKVSAPRMTEDDGGAAEEAAAAGGGGGGGAGGEAVGALKRGLVSGMMKKHLVEAVVPVLVELKRQLEAAHHPLLAALRQTFCALLKDYKGEVEDILVGDRQLAKEILYDMKESEAAAKAAASSVAAAVATAATPAPGSAVLRTPGTGQPTTGAAATTLPSGATAATPLAATVLRSSAPRTGVGAVSALRLGTAGKQRTPFAPPSAGGGTATTPAAAVAASTEPFDSQAPLSVPRLRRSAGAAPPASEDTGEAAPPVVALPGLDEAGKGGREQWNVPPEVADGTPARRGTRAALADSNSADVAGSGGSRRSARTIRAGKENPSKTVAAHAGGAVKTETTRAARAGTRKRRA